MINPEVDRIAQLAHEEAEYLYSVYAGSDFDIFATWYETVTHACNAAGIDAKDVLNHQLYEWYYGNSLHMMICFIYFPQIVRNHDGNIRFLSRKQCYNTIYTIFTMIAKGDVSLDVVDYYGETVCSSCESLVNLLRTTLSNPDIPVRVPSHLLEISDTLIHLLKKGHNMRKVQNQYVLAFLEERRRRRRIDAAMSTIIKWVAFWVSEYFYSPYTRGGKRMLRLRARKFAMDACN